MSEKLKSTNINKKKMWWCIAAGAVAVVALVLGLVLGLTLGKKGSPIALSDAKVVQVGKDQKVNVSWQTDKAPQKVEISVLKSNGIIENYVTITNPSTLAKGSYTIDSSYGKNKVNVTVYNGDYKASRTLNSNVFTDEYVIAPLVATMPVTLFSLQLSEYTNNYQIPTFVWLQRGAAWNYNQMPENVYLVPMGDLNTMSAYNDADQMHIKTSEWVGELYEINPESKFHLYVNDYHPFVWLQATIANHIPSSQYDVTLLTDGTASNYVFEQLYKKESAAADYDRMVQEYASFKQSVWDKNDPSSLDSKGLTFNINDIRNYVLQMLKEEENVKIVLTRDYFNASNNADTNETIKGYVNDLKAENKIKTVNLYTLLNNLDETGKQNVKKLYKFGDNMFEKAQAENKDAMVIMGTRTAGESNFDDYVAATKAFYGNNYVYYYKGHPWTPTASDATKAKHLNDLGLIDIDSTISAELIFYFNQDIVGTGYASTTYGSLNENQVGGIWGTSLESALADYSANTKFVLNKLTSSHAKYGSLATSNSYLFEFTDTTNYDIAVFDAKTNKIEYYKVEGSNFTKVNK